jgi:transcriptional regulator with XRE-family HTH domain
MKTASNKVVGSRIRGFRNARALTQKELGEKSGIHENTIARLERGKHTATTPTLADLADALNVTVDNLIKFNALEEEQAKSA